MKSKFYTFCMLIATFTSCGDAFITMDISQFDIQNERLPDKSLVKVISFSGMPDLNNEAEYYIHMIMVSQANNDTLNLLTIKPAGILSDEDKIMHYNVENSPIYQALLSTLGQKSSQLTKVVVDKNFKEDLNNSYPTVIGILGNVTN